jgi:hypothetical protein
VTRPSRIEALIADLRLTAASLQQVLDACHIAGPGAELMQHYPKMLAELADRFAGEAGRVEWPADLPREPVFTAAELEAIGTAEALLARLRTDDPGSTGTRR